MAIADWLDCMPDTITVEPYTGLSADGLTTPTYDGSPVSYPARIEMESDALSATEINILRAVGRIIVGTTTIFDKRDRLTLPSGFVPSQPPIVAIRPVRDEEGAHHTVVLIGDGRR